MSKPVHLLEPTADAQKWRDLSPKAQKQELALKIGLFAAAAILAIGMAVSIYFCVTTHYTYINHAGQEVTASFAALSEIPALLGTVGVIGLIVAGILVNFEIRRNGRRNGSSWKEDLSNPAIRDDRKLLLTEGKLQEVYDHYYKKNGGLGPLVRLGFLTPDQGKELREIFEEYAANKTVMENFETCDSSFAKDVKEHPENYPEYNTAKEKVVELENSWTTGLREKIVNNFTFLD